MSEQDAARRRPRPDARLAGWPNIRGTITYEPLASRSRLAVPSSQVSASTIPSFDPSLLRGLAAPLRAVVALSRRSGGDAFAFESSGFRSPSFQKSFLAKAEELAVLGLILVELDRTGRITELQPAPGYTAGHLRLLRRQAAMWDLERDAVLRQLSNAGVPVLLLKGAALRMTAYRDPAERAFGDIDVMVPAASLEAAVAALAENGYVPESDDRIKLYLEHYHHLILKKAAGFIVEVHWALVPVMSPFRLDAEAFRRDARAIATPGAGEVAVPCAEHMVLHLAQQNMEDGFSQLRRLVDVDRVIASAAEFDWARLDSEAKRMQVQAVLALTLRLAALLLGTTIPRGFIAGLGLSAATLTHLALLDPVGLVLEQRGRQRAVQELLLLWCLPRAATRLRTLMGMASGQQERLWRQLGWYRSGALTKISSLAKLAVYQAALYPTLLFGERAGARRRRNFWGSDFAPLMKSIQP